MEVSCGIIVPRMLRCVVQISVILLLVRPFCHAPTTQASGRVVYRSDDRAGLAPSLRDERWALEQAPGGEGIPMGERVPGGLSDQPDWSVVGEIDGDLFGDSLASAGDVNGDGYGDVVVGAVGHPGLSNEGKVYVFHGSPVGLDTAFAWAATGEEGWDGFGASVAGVGDVNGDGYADIVVAAPDIPPDKGKIYIYTGSANGLSSTPSWSVEGDSASDHFGASVSGAGDVNGDGYADIVVGAPMVDGGKGQAYLYLGGPAGPVASDWSVRGKDAGDTVGSSVSGAGDVNGDGYADVAVGGETYPAGKGRGVAYVYHGSATGLSTTPAWTKIGEHDYDYFAAALAAAGDVNGDGYADLVASARDFAGVDKGRAYVYPGSPSGLDLTPLWTGLGLSVGDQYGFSVSGAGDVDGDGYADLIVGARSLDTQRGIIYVYHGSPTGLSTAWLTKGEHDNDYFGHAVAGAGDVNGDGFADIVAGAYGHPDGGNRGKAYGYYGRGDHPSLFDDWNQTGENTEDHFGYSVAPAGDVNGDGYGDVIVGAPNFPNVRSQGKAYVYHGSGNGLSVYPVWTAVGEKQGDWFGTVVAAAGDVNGDGYADVIVGALGYPGTDYQGKIYLYYGSPTGLSIVADWTAEGQFPGDQLGGALASAGDLNGDGYADVVAGAPAYPMGNGVGKAYAYFGSASGLGPSADWTVEGENKADYFAASVAGIGDENGDGYGDLVVGAPGHQAGSSRGKAYLYHGGSLGPGTTPDWTDTGQSDGSSFGASVSTAGDVNGDGHADLVVGATGFQGGVFLYHGAPAGFDPVPEWGKMGEDSGDNLGTVVATAGDVDGDGFADVIAGADYYSGGAERGKAYLFSGSSNGLDPEPIWVCVGENNLDRYGISAASAGDVNGDGYPEVIVGARGYPAGANRGKVYVYDGNRARGREVLARQTVSEDSGPLIQPWGLVQAGNRFVVSMWATDPTGRGRVKLEVEACPSGVVFGEGSCIRHVSPTWVDVTAMSTGVQFVETISGLEPERLYRWRARVLYAPFTVNQPGIVAPPNPAHGPWRRFQGQAFEADLRTMRGWTVYLPTVLKGPG